MRLVGAAVALALGVSAVSPSAGASEPSSRRVADWHGSRHAMPTRYAWLDDVTPADTYTVIVVRGMGRHAVLTKLGGVTRRLPDKTPGQALDYVYNHMRPDYSAPHVAQVQRRGHSIVVYAPTAVIDDDAVATLSRRGVAAEFFTDVELDTYVTVARHGKLIRQFDAGFKPPKKGALPAEKGLDWGAKHQNIFATAWAFDERLTRTHLSKTWFDRVHPTFVVGKGAFL